ncbi:UDP-glycosyltransferase 76H1-like [Rutidosis leptorrhynchoides]|uniref:UDP-glycosyltransferase 76H1-like n=1 Tax=Rutidosis leptorrhynchoides TaxID=125765 RepID=UPI003A9A6267
MAKHHGTKPWPLVVLTACPLHGHMTGTLQLATTLHAKGFHIAFAHSTLNPPDPTNLPPDFIFLPLFDHLTAVDDSRSFTTFLKEINNECKASFKEHLIRLIGEGNKSIVVIYDNNMFFAGIVALDLNLAAISFRPNSAAYLPATLARLQLCQQSRFLEQDFVMNEMVPNYHPIRYKDLPFSGSPIEDWKELVAIFNRHPRPSAIIVNTIKSLEHEALTLIHNHYNVPVFAIGPLHKIKPTGDATHLKGDTSCITWLDKQSPKSVIYISFGSLATLDANVLTEMVWGLAQSNRPFLWAVRPGSVCGWEWVEFLPEGFLEETKDRGLIVKWAPQKEVLSHFAVGGFWSHGGWNSILESVSEGVPMICQPFIADHMVNTRYASYVYKIGIELEVFERGEIERMIRKLMVDEGNEIRVRANNMKKMVEIALESGGCSHDSLDDLVRFICSC